MLSPGQGNSQFLPLPAARRRLAFAVVLTASINTTMVFTVMPPLLPAIAKALGGGSVGTFNAQMALTLPSLGWLVFGGISGWLLARLGMRSAIILSLVAVGLFGSVAGLISNPVLFEITRFATGFAAALTTTACMTLLAAIYDEESRSKMIGYYAAVGTAVALPSGLFSGMIAHQGNWRASFSLYAIFGAVAVVLALVGIPAKANTIGSSNVASGERASIVKLLPILVLIYCMQIPLLMPVAVFPFVLAKLGVHEPTLMGLIMGGGSLLMSVGAIASGYLSARIGSWAVLLLGFLIIAIGYAGIGFATSWEFAAAANVVGLMGVALFLPLNFSLPLARVKPEARASAVGLSQAVVYLSSGSTPFIYAPLRNLAGVSGMYVVEAAACAAAAVIGGLILLRSHRRQAPARAAENLVGLRNL